MLTINDWPAPTPSAMTLSLEDVSGGVRRSASGDAVMDVTATKRRLKLRWAWLDGAQLAALLSAVAEGFFEVAWPDSGTGGTARMACWCAARSMGVLRLRDGEPVWTNIEMEWMER